MTLRLRLTLFYTLLVTIILGMAGAGLHLLLNRSLISGVDESLEEAANLVAAVTETVDGTPRLLNRDEVSAEFPGDLVALLYLPGGAVAERLGDVPTGLPALGSGYAIWNEWRAFSIPLEAGSLTVLRSLGDTRGAVRRFDSLFLLLAPLAVVAAFVLGYMLAGRVLAPVDRLTRAAHDLARRRAWRERLPEPRQHDELWRLARSTNDLLAALEAVIESERRFTADAAHELRTPLTLVQGRLEKGREQADDPALVRAAFDTALEANSGLEALVDKLLALARTESGQGLGQDHLALDEVAFDAAVQLRPSFVAKNLALQLDLPDRPVFVTGDATALELAIRNLLDNACKFTKAGTVVLAVSATGSRAILSVTDSGPGVPEGAVPHLFERFYQADIRNRQTGSGLGLSLVRSVAEWHGGDVGVESGPAGGARFVLTLPLSF